MTRRKRKGLGGWRKLNSGRWQYRIRGYRADGQPFQLSQTCDVRFKEQVEAKLKVKAEQYRSGLIVPTISYTLAKWQAKVKKSIPWSPQDASKWKLLRPLWQHKIDAIDQSVIAQWVNKIIYRGDGRPPKGKASPGYVRHCFALLRRLLKIAILEKAIATLPWGPDTPMAIPRYSQAHRKRTTIPIEDIERILNAAKSHSDSLYIRILLSASTGARPIELCNALHKWLVPLDDIQPLPEIVGAAVLRLPAIKGGYAHDVPIAPQIYSIYKQWRESLPMEAQATPYLVPIIGRAGHWKAPSIWVTKESWHTICHKAGVHGYVLYQLRHSRLEFLASTVGPRIAQAIAGHTSVVTTERYIGRGKGVVDGAFDIQWGKDAKPVSR